ncbi:MAG: hypothetical protein ACJAZW_002045 [Maritalea sp.]|jgi:hypothetical protein
MARPRNTPDERAINFLSDTQNYFPTYSRLHVPCQFISPLEFTIGDRKPGFSSAALINPKSEIAPCIANCKYNTNFIAACEY